jgi:hypothetical protein
MDNSPNQPSSQTLASLSAPPRWRFEGPISDPTDAAFRAGAALAILDARVRAEAPFAGAWRRRLALAAAAASAKIIRRGEDEATLRDAFYLRHGAADPGPAGRLLMAWRSLDRSAPLADDAVLHVAGLFGLRVDDALKAAIAGVHEIAASKPAAPFVAAQTASCVVRHRPDAEILSPWLADAALAARLKWPRPLPLAAGALLDRALRREGRRPHPLDDNWTSACCAAYAIAAAQACDVFDELHRRSQTLLAVTSRLRAKGAAAVVEKLHDEDAVPPSGRIGTMSDRALRRLFERLVALGAVRELTGRPTFRLYGL